MANENDDDIKYLLHLLTTLFDDFSISIELKKTYRTNTPNSDISCLKQLSQEEAENILQESKRIVHKFHKEIRKERLNELIAKIKNDPEYQKTSVNGS